MSLSVSGGLPQFTSRRVKIQFVTYFKIPFKTDAELLLNKHLRHHITCTCCTHSTFGKTHCPYA